MARAAPAPPNRSANHPGPASLGTAQAQSHVMLRQWYHHPLWGRLIAMPRVGVAPLCARKDYRACLMTYNGRLIIFSAQSPRLFASSPSASPPPVSSVARARYYPMRHLAVLPLIAVARVHRLPLFFLFLVGQTQPPHPESGKPCGRRAHFRENELAKMGITPCGRRASACGGFSPSLLGA